VRKHARAFNGASEYVGRHCHRLMEIGKGGIRDKYNTHAGVGFGIWELGIGN
jgi:hypothetical protein